MLKKIFVALALIGLFHTVSHAVGSSSLTDRSHTIRYRIETAAATASTSAVIIDLSDTTNYPHKETGYVVVDSIRIQVDKAAASTCTVRVGVVNFVNSSTGSVTWFATNENLLNVSNTDNDPLLHYGMFPIKLYVTRAATADTQGGTPFLLSNETTNGSTTYQNDVALPSPILSGSSRPGVGDVVIDINKTATAAITFGVEISYHTERK